MSGILRRSLLGQHRPDRPPGQRRHEEGGAQSRHDENDREERGAQSQIPSNSSRTFFTISTLSGHGKNALSKPLRIIRSSSLRVKPSSVCASQYSSLKETPAMSQPSVQSVTLRPAS